MYCSMCGTEIESDEQAIEDGWLPSFWDGETHHEVACPNCADKFLAVGEDGEIEVKPEYRGKIVYVDTDTSEHLLIGFAVVSSPPEGSA